MSDRPIGAPATVRHPRPPTIQTTGLRPLVSQSIHSELLEQVIPHWLTAATTQRRQQIKDTEGPLPDWYQRASPQQRAAVNECAVASFTAQTRLDKAMSSLQDIDTFAEPLLRKALKDQFQVELDVNKTFLQLRKPVEVGIFPIDIASFDVLNMPLLQAALHNFEASECQRGAFDESSGFLRETSTPGTFEKSPTALTVVQFTRLCRSLDLGAKYQAYLKAFLHPADAMADQVLREKFATAQKTALRVAAEMALMKKDIEPRDYTTILSVIEGHLQPRQGNKQVWFNDLILMKHRLTGCVVFSICEKYRYSEELILYVPNDPHHPLKRYTYAELEARFKVLFTVYDDGAPDDGSPSAYQRFFSQFVAYADRPDYFNQFTVDLRSPSFIQRLTPYVSLLNDLSKGVNPFAIFTEVKGLPPVKPGAKGRNDDPFLAPVGVSRKGHGIWADNVDLWTYLFEQHRAKIIGDARSHAVPSADIDARVRSEKFARLLNIGMLALTGVSMFVPVLGEVMLGVMAGQLLEETLEGSIEWSEGDRKAAKAHLLDVAENMALLAVTAGVGKGLAKLTAVKAESMIERLEPVTRADGQARLWKPDLARYESPVILDRSQSPNAQGQYSLEGKTYIRQANKVYEQTWDESLKRWRIKHPSDPLAYQPLLNHNGVGAWRLTLERPLAWDRLTLLRRMGHVTDAFSDQQLLSAADISGVSDNTLRKMHLDNAPPPPELADTLRLFEARQNVPTVIQQLTAGEAIDDRYMAALPLLTELPRWPTGRVLAVFDDPALTGSSVKYGAERLFAGVRRKPAIRISRADVLSGELPARVLAALDEAEITGMLGGEPARVRDARPGELKKQWADYALTRQPALFENLYKARTVPTPQVARLQRLHPGLSEPAAQAVLAGADSEQLSRLHTTGRVPLALQEQARWHAQQGRVSRAYAGLHQENVASTDSHRLALQALSKLPGWSDQVRLEIREGHIGGTLLDGIGRETARSHKYLVKQGPFYQAFNERGERLNSLPRHGDNFYPSLMHALPDEARQSLGFPHTGQSEALRSAIIDYAMSHRADMAARLESSAARRGTRKPPARLKDQRIGYYASGDGPAMDISLVTRVQDIYPGLTDQQATRYLLKLRRTGQTDAQIYGHLQARLREWQTLESTLDQWAHFSPPGVSQEIYGRRSLAEKLKTSWRNAPLVEEHPHLGTLDITHMDSLPPITADFSHVLDLTVIASGTDTLLTCFPNLEKLHLFVRSGESAELFQAIRGMRRLTCMRVYALPSTELMAALKTLPQLEELSLDMNGSFPRRPEDMRLDFSDFKQLRRLELVDRSMTQWPTGIADLPLLERLNLRRTGINTLPTANFEGQERLLAGLSLDWSKFPRETFKPIYEYVSRLPRHLIDLEEMVGDYCRGELLRFSTRQMDVLSSKFLQQWPGAQARFDAIEALSTQHAELERQLAEWSTSAPDLPLAHFAISTGSSSLRASWRNGLFRRYGTTTGSSDLDRLFGYMTDSSGLELSLPQLSVLPRLPTGGFAHVQTLRLIGLQAPAQQVREFVRGFSALRTLDLSGSHLTDLPLVHGDLPTLEHLNLRNSVLTRLDVSGMDRLQSLCLAGSDLRTWPTGAENLPQLTWLDLRNSQLNTLPQTLLSSDSLLINSNLTGAALTPQSQAALATALQRVERVRGLEDGTLSRFALQRVPDDFPAAQSGASISRHLLPLPPPETAEDLLSLERRLHRLCPDLGANEPGSLIEEMRAKGATDLQLHERFNEWNQAHEALIRRLNDWIYVRESQGAGWVISSRNRQLAALRIMECWRQGLMAEGTVAQVLSLDGLQLGNLPELPVAFPHVDTLNLTGVGFTEQGSNAFLQAFGELRTLVLNANELQALPDAVDSMSHLQSLELSSNNVVDPQPLYRSLAGHGHLRTLDLSRNNLEVFDAGQFEQLETLDLRNNRLTDWPQGVLQASGLRRLNLSNNDISSIPAGALDGQHDVLMSGTDLSDNLSLSRTSLEQLRAYAEAGQRNDALGLSTADIDRMIDEIDQEHDAGSDTQSVISDEDISDQELEPEQREPWFETLEPEAMAEHQSIWAQLESEPDHQAFFHLLLRLQDTDEFRFARADLTRRVWSVLRAAADNTELRQIVFAMSTTHGTCIDGRILTFSGIEIKVFEYNALLDVDSTDLAKKGAALLKLSRQLFRLDQVEALAAQSPAYRNDAAEARLEYRLGLKDALDLPGQPKNMSYGRPITGQTLSDAIDAVQKAEKSERFYEDLTSRPYWVEYLEEKYPQEFRELETRKSEKNNQLEDDHPDITSSAYGEALEMLGIDLAIERNQKLIELSRKEAGEITPTASGEPQPGTSKNLTPTL
jgi:Leucine-rich repeat (LRR) protein